MSSKNQNVRDDGLKTSEQIIKKAKQGFEKALFASDYAQIHLDEQHLATLLSLGHIVKGKRYLDLGTGNGYIAFALARRHPDLFVTGLDIVQKAIAANNRRAQAEQLHHLDFMSYDGAALPFEGSHFFGVINRYAFHHFPNPAFSAGEVYRILESGGFCLIADPAPASEDETDFINHFMALKDDGHVRFYTAVELDALFDQAGFKVEKRVQTSITFPRRMNRDYEQLIAQTPRAILEAYRLRIVRDQAYVTVAVLNSRFKRS